MESTDPAKNLFSNEKFKEIIKSNGIEDPIAEIDFGDSGLLGENRCSGTNYVTVKFQEGQKKPIHLFVKRREKGANPVVDEGVMFEKESMFFSEYIPIARKYCQSLGKENILDIYQKCYYADHTMIVFENLVVEKGYAMLDKGDRQNFEAARLAITNLGKHHAISHAMIKYHGGSEPFLDRFQYFKVEPYSQPSVRSMGDALEQRVNLFLQLVEKSGLKNGNEAITKLKTLQGKTWELMIEPLLNDSSRFRVLNHGDYWNNNMMFIKDKESGNLLKHIPVDFQLLRYVSPGLDLGYYLFSSVKGDVRRNKFNELLEIYLDALKTTAEELGHPIELTMEELKKEYCTYFGFGFFIGAVFMCDAYFAVLKAAAGEDNMDDWHTSVSRLMNKWADENPERCIQMAKDIIKDVNEYINICNGIC